MPTNISDLQSNNIIEESVVNPSLKQIVQPIIPKEYNLFPNNLESSGYIILVAIALIFGISFLFNILVIRRLISITKKSQHTFVELTSHLYIQQQLMEYRLLLAELNGTESAIEKTNARTQLYNYLNNLSLNICTLSNNDIALQLAQAFFSKIYGRYLKLNPLPDGIIYFKYVGSSLHNMQGMTEKDILKALRKNYKSRIKEYQELNRETLGQTSNTTKGFFNKKK